MNPIDRNTAFKELSFTVEAAKSKLQLTFFSRLLKRDNVDNLDIPNFQAFELLQKQLAARITQLESADKQENVGWFKRWWDGRKIAQAEKLYLLLSSKLNAIYYKDSAKVIQYQKEKVQAAIASHPVNLANSKANAEQQLTILTRDYNKTKAKLTGDIKLTQEIIDRHEQNINMHRGSLEKKEASLKLMDLIDKGGQDLQNELTRQNSKAQGDEAARRDAALKDWKEFKLKTEKTLEEYAKVLKTNQDGLAKLEQQLKDLETNYTQNAAELKKIIEEAETSLKSHAALPKTISNEDKVKIKSIEERMAALEPKVAAAKAKVPELRQTVETLERENALFDKKLAICRRIADENNGAKVLKELTEAKEVELLQFAQDFQKNRDKQTVRNTLNQQSVELAGRLGAARKELRDAETPLNEWNRLEAEKKSLS